MRLSLSLCFSIPFTSFRVVIRNSSDPFYPNTDLKHIPRFSLESIVSTLKEQVPPAGTMPPHHPGYGIQSRTTVTTPTTTASPVVGMGVASSHHQQHYQQQQQQYYFRTINNVSPSPQLTHPPPAAPMSPVKLQKAAQIQSIPSSSGKQYMHLPSSAINVSGPVTDL